MSVDAHIVATMVMIIVIVMDGPENKISEKM